MQEKTSNIISLKEINFSYSDKKIFENLSISFPQNQIISLIGPTGEGKSTIFKIINHFVNFEGQFFYEDKQVNNDNINQIRPNLATLLPNPQTNFICETIIDTLTFPLENQGYSKDQIQTSLEEIQTYYDYTDIKDNNPNNLNRSKKQLISLLSLLIYHPKVLMLDNALECLSPNDKITVENIIKNYRKHHDLTIINATSNIEDTLTSDYIVILNQGKVYLEGNTLEVLKQTEELQRIGLNIPFIVELSQNLILYNLIDDIHTDIRKLVNTLWK